MTNLTAVASARPSLTPQPCLICQTPLPWQPVRRDLPLCGRSECAWRYQLLGQQHKLCRVCGRPLSAHEQPARICASLDCQRAFSVPLLRRERQRQEARQTTLRQQATALRDQVADDFDLTEPHSFPVAILPACTVGIAPLPAKRRRAFRAYLQDLIARAYTVPVPPSTEPAAAVGPTHEREARLGRLLAHGCACCQGSCCQGGAHTHAYLTVDTIQRYRATHPRQGPRAVLAAYLRLIGRHTYTNSCVYHQADGCSLPQSMRADLCNRFFCSGLTEFVQQLPAQGPLRGFVVAADSSIRRAALLHEDRRLQTEVPIPLAEPDPNPNPDPNPT